MLVGDNLGVHENCQDIILEEMKDAVLCKAVQKISSR